MSKCWDGEVLQLNACSCFTSVCCNPCSGADAGHRYMGHRPCLLTGVLTGFPPHLNYKPSAAFAEINRYDTVSDPCQRNGLHLNLYIVSAPIQKKKKERKSRFTARGLKLMNCACWDTGVELPNSGHQCSRMNQSLIPLDGQMTEF